jgi:hypothetical protein
LNGGNTVAVTVAGIEQILKGRIAESIVEQMFVVSGRRIHRFGFEWKLPVLNPLQQESLTKRDEVLDKLRNTPDFIVERNDGKVELVEVKYRQQGRFSIQDEPKLERLQEMWSPTLILVSYNRNPKYKLDPQRNPLEASDIMAQKEWGISSEVYEACVGLLHIYQRFIPENVLRTFPDS